MFLDWMIPLWATFISSGFWSYFVLPFFCLAFLVVISRLLMNFIRWSL